MLLGQKMMTFYRPMRSKEHNASENLASAIDGAVDIRNQTE